MAKLKSVSSKDVGVVEVKNDVVFLNFDDTSRREFKLETGERLYTNFPLEDEKLYIDVIDNCQCEKEFVIYDIAFDINGRVVDNCKALYVMGDKYISEFSNAIQAEKQKRKR